MKRPDIPTRPTDDKTLLTETKRSREEWFNLLEQSGASGRAAIGKALQAAKLDPWWIGTITVEYEARTNALEKDGRPKGYSLCTTKSVAATAARTFAAFTTPADLDKWFAPGSKVDAKEGGAFSNADGNRGTIKKLRPEKALVFTWDAPDFGDGSQVEVLFQPKDAKCGIVVNHTRVISRADADALRAGWEAALNRLKAYLET